MSKKTILNLKRGFTLIELLVVIAVIGILVAIVMEVGSAAKAGARDNQRKTDIRLIQVKLEAYRGQYGVYPGATGLNDANFQTFLPASVLPKDPINNGVYQYTYIPLQFSGGAVCGTGYYLYDTLENNSDTQVTTAPLIAKNLVSCGGAFPVFPNSKIYDVVSPS